MRESQIRHYKIFPIEYFEVNCMKMKKIKAMLMIYSKKSISDEVYLMRRELSSMFNFSERAVDDYIKFLKEESILIPTGKPNTYKVLFDFEKTGTFISFARDYYVALKEKDLIIEDLLVHSALLLDSQEFKSYMSIRMLAKKLNCNEKVIMKSLKNLEEKGLIKSEVNEYRKNSLVHTVILYDRDNETILDLFDRYRHLHINALKHCGAITYEEYNKIIKGEIEVKKEVKVGVVIPDFMRD